MTVGGEGCAADGGWRKRGWLLLSELVGGRRRGLLPAGSGGRGSGREKDRGEWDGGGHGGRREEIGGG